MKHLLLFSILLCGNKSHSQCENQGALNCNGLKEISTKAFVVLNVSLQKDFIKKSDLLNFDLRLGAADSTLKIIGFVVGYDCHSRSLFDYNCKAFMGNRVKANDPFVRNVWIGDILVIDCINVEKNGTKYLIKGLQFEVY